MATEIWRQFEKRIGQELNLQRNTVVAQIPSHMNQSKGRVFRKKTDCDFAAGVDGRAVYFDAKVCAEPRFNANSLILRESKIHQYRFLKSALEKGSIGGYLIWFYGQRKIVWLPVEMVDNINRSFAWDDARMRSQDDDKPIDLKALIWGDV